MALGIDFRIDKRDLQILESKKTGRAFEKSLRRAGSTAFRDGKATGVKLVRADKRIKVKLINQSITGKQPKGRLIDRNSEWVLTVRNRPIPIGMYHRPRQSTRFGGVTVGIKRGGRSVIPRAFTIKARSAQKDGLKQWVYARQGSRRPQIKHLFSSTVRHVMGDQVDPILKRMLATFEKTFKRNLRIELSKFTTP